ncbi:unnamed protein product [Mytilus edulis]|uniref:Integrase zinc-binding domain-containing protein n=1 Tax=Mytilus edulis TaxID=6550 RepID=A0A8S3SDX2_MYTED|nr:unnamed protein product [Mytilus edulis]
MRHLYNQCPTDKHQNEEETEKHIDIMLKNDIIEESNSPWSSPIVLVSKKKSNMDAKQEYRFAVDYRRLNKCTLRAKFSIPRIDDVFDTVANSKAVMYSVLDLMVDFSDTPRSRNKTQICICNTPRYLPIQKNEFWVNKCTNGFSNAHDKSFKRIELESCFREERTYEAVRQRYYWPNMYTDIKTYIKTCEICQRSKRNTHSHPLPLKPMPIEEVFQDGTWIF